MTYRSGKRDYTGERHQWLAGVTIEETELENFPETPL